MNHLVFYKQKKKSEVLIPTDLMQEVVLVLLDSAESEQWALPASPSLLW